MLRALKTLDLNCAIHLVSSGQEAIAYLSGKSPFANRTQFPVPHLLLLDLKMPEIDGLQVLRWLRNQPALDGLNVVVVTESDLDRDIIKAKELGAKDFILKAGDTVDLVHSVREMTFQWLS